MKLSKFQSTIRALAITLPVLLLIFFIVGAALAYGEWRTQWSIHFQNVIRIEPTQQQPIVLIKTVEAKNVTTPILSSPKAETTELPKK
jgi:hypothetical protein